MTRIRRSVALFTFVAFFGNVAGAQVPDAPAAPAAASLTDTLTGAAKADYENGKVLYGDGDFAGARVKFEAAYQTSKDARLLWNVAACEKNQRHYARAVLLIDRYIAESGDKLSPQDRADAETFRKAIEAFVGTLVISTEPTGATVYVDDEAVGTTPLPRPVQVDIGQRRIRAAKEGFEDGVQQQSISGGGSTTLTFTLMKRSAEGRLGIVASSNDDIRVDGKLVGTGSYEGRIAAGKHHLVVSAPGKITYETDVMLDVGEVRSLRISLESEKSGGLPAWAWVASGVALAGLGTGAYFLFRPSDEKSTPTVVGTIPPGTLQLP